MKGRNTIPGQLILGTFAMSGGGILYNYIQSKPFAPSFKQCVCFSSTCIAVIIMDAADGTGLFWLEELEFLREWLEWMGDGEIRLLVSMVNVIGFWIGNNASAGRVDPKTNGNHFKIQNENDKEKSLQKQRSSNDDIVNEDNDDTQIDKEKPKNVKANHIDEGAVYTKSLSMIEDITIQETNIGVKRRTRQSSKVPTNQ